MRRYSVVRLETSLGRELFGCDAAVARIADNPLAG
jgi:hypothetical protein